MKITPIQIRLTRSRDNTTGTVVFKFNIEDVIKSCWLKSNQINCLILNDNNFKLQTKNLKLIFINGKPKFLYGIFIFKNVIMWNNFLNFIQKNKKNNLLTFRFQ